MKFTLDRNSSHTISHWESAEIRVDGKPINHHVIVSPTMLDPEWEPKSGPEALSVEDLKPAIDLDPEVLIVGTGTQSMLPSPQLTAALASQGIGLEFMDTRAACRTFNVLSGEGRQVVAALFIGAANG